LVEALKNILKFLEIKTEVVLATGCLESFKAGPEGLVDLCKSVGGEKYLSGATCLEYGFTHEFAADNDLTLVLDKYESHFDNSGLTTENEMFLGFLHQMIINGPAKFKYIFQNKYKI
jgi:hypothetical protein